MTDLEMTKLCAKALGFPWTATEHRVIYCPENSYAIPYNPLHDDAQAMALVKKFRLSIDAETWAAAVDSFNYFVHKWNPLVGDWYKEHGQNPNLNRAIVECVANLQAAK